jgi:hypothetical protein
MLGAAVGLVVLVSKAQVKLFELSHKKAIAGDMPRGFIKA